MTTMTATTNTTDPANAEPAAGKSRYTILDQPYWNPNGTGTQYTGPWVEVLDYLCDYADEFGLTLSSPGSMSLPLRTKTSITNRRAFVSDWTR